ASQSHGVCGCQLIAGHKVSHNHPVRWEEERVSASEREAYSDIDESGVATKCVGEGQSPYCQATQRIAEDHDLPGAETVCNNAAYQEQRDPARHIGAEHGGEYPGRVLD